MREDKKFGFVNIIGVANVGKTTLLNNLVQFKVGITSPKPQTTRNRIIGIKTTEKAQIAYIDHPGYHIPKFALNKVMQKNALLGLKEADLILLLLDSTKKIGIMDLELIGSLKKSKIKNYILLNKIDLIKKEEVLTLIGEVSKLVKNSEIFPISALKGTNLKELEEEIIKNLPSAPFLFKEDQWTTQSERFYISEIIREKIINLTEKEVPYSVAVLTEKMEEEEDLLKIFCTILVEKESQKPILIGKNGKMLKEIGMGARKELEDFFGTKVYLELYVKVKERWRENLSIINEIIEKG